MWTQWQKKGGALFIEDFFRIDNKIESILFVVHQTIAIYIVLCSLFTGKFRMQMLLRGEGKGKDLQAQDK